MKCIRLKKTGKVYRVDNLLAAQTVDTGEAMYTTKQAWKKEGRNYFTNKSMESRNDTKAERISN